MSLINKTITVFGSASQRVVKELSVNESDLDLTLMEYLRKEAVPVASSCYGEGICQKCSVRIDESDQLSCLITVRKFLNSSKPKITITYL
tara:strand:+ start:3928 stop:4197 length:270 start_codon:yes stop_codon:yes gene_type:complete